MLCLLLQAEAVARLRSPLSPYLPTFPSCPVTERTDLTGQIDAHWNNKHSHCSLIAHLIHGSRHITHVTRKLRVVTSHCKKLRETLKTSRRAQDAETLGTFVLNSNYSAEVGLNISMR